MIFLIVKCIKCIKTDAFFQWYVYRLLGKTRVQNDLLCVDWDIEPYSLTHLTYMYPDHTVHVQLALIVC